MVDGTFPNIGDVADVARISRIPRDTLIRLRLQHPEDSPPHYYVGRRVYYPLTGPNSLLTWMEARVSAPQRRRVG
jgi:hypothetical protein